MATFEECIGGLDEFQGFLERQFDDALYATGVHPVNHEENPEYCFDVAFTRELREEEARLIGHEFKGIPVVTRVLSPKYIFRKELE